MQTVSDKEDFRPFNPLRVIIPVLLLTLSVSFAARWYAQQVSLPRYCEDPAQALHHLEQIIVEDRPAGDSARKPYIIAAKLLFLLPLESSESREDYLQRVQQHLRRQCG